MPLTSVEQRSAPPPGPKAWVGEFAPQLSGLTLSLPAWRFHWPGGAVDLPATSLTFAPDATYTKQVWLYVVPTFDGVDNYHLDELLQDGLHTRTLPEPFSGIGPLLVLWGTVPSAGEPDLYYLKHLPEAP